MYFYIHQLIIDEENFNINDFEEILGNDIDTNIVDSTGEEELISVTKVNVSKKDNRFILIYMSKGSKFPYTDKVMTESLEEKPNPREKNEIELSDQFFALIDCKTQRMYISNSSYRKFFQKWISVKLGKSTYLKSVLDEKQFVEKINEISSISLTVEPNLLAEINSLSKHTQYDIFGFGADEAEIKFKYKSSKFSDKIKEKVKELISQRSSFKSLVVVGRTQENIESVLNMDTASSKLSIKALEDESKMYDPDQIFNELISKIR